MLNYPLKATSTKDFVRFNFSTYNSLSVNMLKYNHDSSATIRFLGAILDALESEMEDLYYLPNFTLTELEFINIDRMNAFVVEQIEEWTAEGTGEKSYVFGYSRYTDSEYLMYIEEKQTDFVRHSLPVDAFFSDRVLVQAAVTLDLPSNIKTSIGLEVQNSSVSIELDYGFINSNRRDLDEPISLIVTGRDIHNDEISERVEIETVIPHNTMSEFSYIDNILALNTNSNIGVTVHPYLTGEQVVYDKMIVERDSLDEWVTIVSVDTEAKQLVLSLLGTDATKYPLDYEKYKTVDINLPVSYEITSFYCDVANKLLYITATDGAEPRLYTFPLVIPTSYNNTLDDLKTKTQSIKLEYIEDSVNEKFTFWVHPCSKSNDIELMAIWVDGVLWQEDILLDLLSSNIETNKFDIPFSTLFATGQTSLVEFKAYGNAGETNCPVHLSRQKLNPFYFKDAVNIESFKTGPALNIGYIEPIDIITIGDYKEHGAYAYGDEGYGGILDGGVFAYGGGFNKSLSSLFKLSSAGNVMFDGVKIINVFNSFYWDEANNFLVTSDTITHLTVKRDYEVLGTELDEIFNTENKILIGV